ncbi:hypothetical protein L9F63_027921, partial [Diploptera punctata]
AGGGGGLVGGGGGRASTMGRVGVGVGVWSVDGPKLLPSSNLCPPFPRPVIRARPINNTQHVRSTGGKAPRKQLAHQGSQEECPSYRGEERRNPIGLFEDTNL